MNHLIGVYEIIHIYRETRYIGSSKNIGIRWGSHTSELNNGVHGNYKLQNAWDKYGSECFSFKVLETCKESELLKVEQRYLDMYTESELYNLTFLAEGGGGDTTANPVVLLDICGNFVRRFRSGMALAKFLDRRQLCYKNINTKSVLTCKKTGKKYRMVTDEFLENNKDIIETWPPYTCKTTYESNFKTHFRIVKNGRQIKEFDCVKKTADYLGLATGTVHRLIKEKDGHYKKQDVYIFKKMRDYNTYD